MVESSWREPRRRHDDAMIDASRLAEYVLFHNTFSVTKNCNVASDRWYWAAEWGEAS